jgi:hypothetical protein
MRLYLILLAFGAHTKREAFKCLSAAFGGVILQMQLMLFK